MDTVFLLIYGLYISGKKYSFKINMTQNYTLIYYYMYCDPYAFFKRKNVFTPIYVLIIFYQYKKIKRVPKRRAFFPFSHEKCYVLIYSLSVVNTRELSNADTSVGTTFY